MLGKILKQIKTAFILIVLLTILTGIIYPAIVTGLAQLFFPWQANGSMILKNTLPIGSQWVGQSFTDLGYFWGRPSATSPFPNNPLNSSGSNLGPLNPDLLIAIKNRITLLQKTNPEKLLLIPVDLVTASASGLDPDISPLAAYYQVYRIAKARGVSKESIRDLIKNLIQTRTWGILGEERVNVLQLNLALDNYFDKRKQYGRATSQS
jgi:K+-transporting ATPase ATPase C chain